MKPLKKRKIESSVKELTAQTGNALDNMMASGESGDQMLARLGISRQQAMAAVIADDEVESCREDLRAAMLAKSWRLYGEGLSVEDSDRLWRTVRAAMPVLAEIVLTAKLNGYAVGRYVYAYDDEGFLTLSRIIDKNGSLDKYTPQADGTLQFEERAVDTHCVYLLLTSRATEAAPAGEAAAARLYPAVALRKHGFLYAAQFISRYAQPYLVGKTNAASEAEHQSFVGRIFNFLSGGAISINSEEQIEMLQNQADGQAFKRLENLANARIQKVLLGKVRTSDLENGSRAAQETEEKNRSERIDGYLYLLTQAAQHLLDALLMVNAAYGRAIHAPQGVWFEFNQEAHIDIRRAERDKHYLDAGQISLTKEYFRDVLGFDESHFKLSEAGPDSTQMQKFALLSAQRNQAQPLRSSKWADGRQPESSSLSAEQIIMRPKIEAILAALEECDGFEQFQNRLSSLNLDSDSDKLLIARLVGDGAASWLQGAEKDAS